MRGALSMATTSARGEGAIEALAHDLLRLLGERLKATTRWPAWCSRRAMLAPIRPRPTIASSTLASCYGRRLGSAQARSLQRQLERRRPGRPTGGSRSDRQAVRLERVEVAQRLRIDEHPERLLAAGMGRSSRMAGDQLQEAAGRRAALVQLAGRVQEARPVAEGRRASSSVADAAAGCAASAASAPASARCTPGPHVAVRLGARQVACAARRRRPRSPVRRQRRVAVQRQRGPGAALPARAASRLVVELVEDARRCSASTRSRWARRTG